MSAVQRLVAAVAHDDRLLADLRRDPAGLGRVLSLTGEQVDSLRAADRFFPTEKPILDAPPAPPPVPPAPPVVVRFLAGAPASTIVVSADTGTLLPGANQGTVSVTGLEEVAPTPTPGVPRTPAAPAHPPVGPVSPSPVPPSAPAAPARPGPPVPAIPGLPALPPTPAPPPWPQPQPLVGPCGCEAAVVAMVANVSLTAQAALAGIAGIAATRAGGRPRAGPVATA